MEKKYLSPINSQSVVQSVIDRITEGIIEGELKPGDHRGKRGGCDVLSFWKRGSGRDGCQMYEERRCDL